jgi:hypothetical protein
MLLACPQPQRCGALENFFSGKWLGLAASAAAMPALEEIRANVGILLTGRKRGVCSGFLFFGLQ